MSDQTSPPTQPTPTPEDGVGSGVGDGANPPPPPGGTVVDSPPPPAPAKKSRTGLIVAIIAALVVLALVAVLLVVFVFAKGDDKHSITIPATAGGMERDKDKETELQQQLDAAETQFKTQFKNVTYVKSGVYDQDDSKRGPEGALVFLGAKVKSAEKNPQNFVDNLTKQATTNGFKIDKISAGEGGGKAVCAYQSAGQKVAICAWATKDSGGELVPTVPGWDSKSLAKVMLDVRSDVEQTS
jgi:hypothetical protein